MYDKVRLYHTRKHMNTEMNAKIEELCNDEDYVKYFLSLGNAEAMSKELESKDIDLSPEELRQIGTLLRKKANGELSDEELEQVSGGVAFAILFYVPGIIFVTGFLIAAAVKSC